MAPMRLPIRPSAERQSETRSALAFAALSLVCLAVFYLPGPIPPAPASVLAIVRWLGLLFGGLFAWLFLQSLMELMLLAPLRVARPAALLALVAAAAGLWIWLA